MEHVGVKYGKYCYNYSGMLQVKKQPIFVLLSVSFVLFGFGCERNAQRVMPPPPIVVPPTTATTTSAMVNKQPKRPPLPPVSSYISVAGERVRVPIPAGFVVRAGWQGMVLLMRAQDADAVARVAPEKFPPQIWVRHDMLYDDQTPVSLTQWLQKKSDAYRFRTSEPVHTTIAGRAALQYERFLTEKELIDHPPQYHEFEYAFVSPSGKEVVVIGCDVQNPSGADVLREVVKGMVGGVVVR